MTETTKIDAIEFEGKAFVFDKTIAQFKCGDTRYFHDEYDQFSGYAWDEYFGEDDPENSIVKMVLEKGGIVRRSISGKTDYYVVGVYDNKSQDYQKQKEKGKPVVAISLEDLKRILGFESESKPEYDFIDVYEPSGAVSSHSAEDIVIEDVAVTGEESADWVYNKEGMPEKLFVRDYIGDKDDITIPTSIDGEKVYLPPQFPNTISFPKCRAKTIRIPGSFKEIPVGLFQYNNCLEEVVVGNGVEEIETSFCYQARNLNKVHFPDSLKRVGSFVLAGTAWEKQQGSEIIAGNVLLHKYADENRSEDVWSYTYTVPDGITCIADYAFCEGEDRDPEYIDRIELPESVRYIGDKAFMSLHLSSIKIPSTEVHIGKSAFNGTRLRSYYEREQYFVIGDLLYELIPNQPVATIPEGVKRIADGAISNYSAGLLEELILPDSVEEIGKASFAGCMNLKAVKFGSNLKRIGDYAFYNCVSLNNGSIPNSVEIVGEDVFGSDPFLAQIHAAQV